MPTPQHCPTPRELADLELLTGGAFAPVTGFNEPGSPITLELPEALRGGDVELVDPEGLPLARLSADGSVEPLTHAQHGPFRRLHRTPAQVRAQHQGATFVPVARALTDDQIARLNALGTPVVLLALTGPGTPALSAVALLRASLAAVRRLPNGAVVAVPLASHGDPSVDQDLGRQVVAAYAGPDAVLMLGDDDHAGGYPDDIAAIVEADRPPPDRQGLVLFFTGLSGSGKSTVAQAVVDALLEQGQRSVTTLDGDVVRRHLSAGLTFSRADRETNIRRIGWVAAEISRHGGLAVCSPIAPFDQTRQDVRAMTSEAGGAFFLVHVATPLEECERRDRKGLYAKARRGEIPDFTGISSPYEVPEDAHLRLDTTGRSIDDCRDEVLGALVRAGLVAADGQQAGAGRADPIRVLFVCTANICRSPYLELRARQLLGPGSGVEVSSAGTQGFDASPVSDTMAAEFARRGTDTGGFRSRVATGELVDGADLVLTAEASHRTRLLEDRPAASGKVFTLGQFAAIAQEADPSLRGRELLEAVRSRPAPVSPGPVSPEHDIADPHRRGPEAARRAAATMEALLEVIVERLRG